MPRRRKACYRVSAQVWVGDMIDDDAARTAAAEARTRLERTVTQLSGTTVWPEAVFAEAREAVEAGVRAWLLRGKDSDLLALTADEALRLRAPSAVLDHARRIHDGEAHLRHLLRAGFGTMPGCLSSLREDYTSWRGAAERWCDEIAVLVDALEQAPAPPPPEGPARVEAGTLVGDLRGLMPAFIIARYDHQFRRRPRGGDLTGVFGVRVPPDDDGCSAGIWEGFILPFAYCRDENLRRGLASVVRVIAPLVRAPDCCEHEAMRAMEHVLQAEGLSELCPDVYGVGRWTALELTRAVFWDVLPAFEMVTAVRDGLGIRTEVLERRPVPWTSRGAFLDWIMDMPGTATDFTLFLALEAEGWRPVPSFGKLKGLFRPVHWWLPFLDRNVPQAPEPVAVALYHEPVDQEAIDLVIQLGARTVDLVLWNDYDPLPDLLDWLHAIASRNLPMGLDLEEGGDQVELLALPLDGDRLLIAVVDVGDDGARAAVVVQRGEFVGRFVAALKRFLRHVFIDDLWGWDTDDPPGYRDRLMAHPVLNRRVKVRPPAPEAPAPRGSGSGGCG